MWDGGERGEGRGDGGEGTGERGRGRGDGGEGRGDGGGEGTGATKREEWEHMARVWERTTLWPVSTERDYFTTIVQCSSQHHLPGSTHNKWYVCILCTVHVCIHIEQNVHYMCSHHNRYGTCLHGGACVHSE